MKCHIIRFQISCALDNGRPLSPRLERHLGKCQECLAHYRTHENVIGHLRKAAPIAVEPPPFLHAKILRALESNQRPQDQAQAWIWRAGALMAAAAVIVLLTMQWPQPAKQEIFAKESDFPNKDSVSKEETVVPVPHSTDKNPVAATAPLIKSGLPDGNRLLHAAARFDQPLRREMALLEEDARATLQALKTGFIPTSLLSGEH